MTLKEIEKLEKLQRKKAREENEARQQALGVVKREPKPDPTKSPGLIIGKSPEERAEYFRKLREEAGLL